MDTPSTFDRSLAVRQSIVYIVAFSAVFAIFSYSTGGNVAYGVATGVVMAAIVIAVQAWSGDLGTREQSE
ncbi:hypothetical protein [Halorubrum trueperi]|uniref:Uncharacterized protein n=1 Tax=Halorubrum trueperi TaxID=2004704 RepID=A0ABD5UKM4_9EURY